MNLKTTLRDIIYEPRWRWVRHLCFWLFIYVEELLILGGVTSYELEFPILLFIQMGLDILIVYFILYVLTPLFFDRDRPYTYIGFVIFFILVDVTIYLLVEDMYYEDYAERLDYLSSFIATSTVVGTALALKLLKDRVFQIEKRERLQSNLKEAELKFLKQQINPHFLFNVLNAINTQTVIAPQDASTSIHKLSNILRYQLYDSEAQPMSTIHKEIDLISDYLDLERIRRDRLEIDMVASGMSDYSIAPFLFLPLVENAVKHSVCIDEVDEKISISLCQESEGNLKFSCTNTIGDAQHEEGGIGLANLRRRLELLYPDHHELTLSEKDGIFNAVLTLDLNELPNSR